MIKNILLSLSLVLSITSNLFAQPSVIPATLSISQEKQEESLIIEHKDVKITVGKLEIYAPFIYQGEIAPKQGYLIGIKDTVRMKDIVTGCQNSCDSLVEVIKSSYEEKLVQCQKRCDERINVITKKNEKLMLEVKILDKSLKSEKRSKFLWSSLSATAGAGLGILIYQIVK